MIRAITGAFVGAMGGYAAFLAAWGLAGVVVVSRSNVEGER